MKKYSGLLVLLMACVIAVSGCGGGGGGGGSKASSNDDDITNAQGVIESFYRLTDSAVTTKLANLVTVIFHVEDNLGDFVTSLTLEEFEVMEGTAEGTAPLPPAESKISITPNSVVPHKFYTVLMIDNSQSIGLENLSELKKTAEDLVEAADPDGDMSTGDHLFLIYSFSETNNLLFDDFSNDVTAINAKIESIGLGDPTTNLYGSVIEGLSKWTDDFDNELVEEGLLVLFTDGNHSQGDSVTLEDVLAERGAKRIITIGAGDEIVPDTLMQLGNAGFYYINDEASNGDDDEASNDEALFFEVLDFDALTVALAGHVIDLREKVELFSRTFYRVNYISPKRDGGSYTLTLTVNENRNTDVDDGAEIKSDYKCTDFFSPHEGIYINNVLPEGGDYYVDISKKSVTNEISFNVYMNKNRPEDLPAPPDFTVTPNGCDDVMTIAQKDLDDPSVYTIKAIANGICNVTITDANNAFAPDENDPNALAVNFSQSIKINITEYGTPARGLIAYYAFDGDTTDSSGNVNTATGYNGEYAKDRFGVDNNTINITGKSEFVRVHDDVSKNTMTVSMWYQFDKIGVAPNTLLGSDNGEYDYLSIDSPSKRIGFYNEEWFHSGFQLIPLRYYHIVLVKDGTNSKLYVHVPGETYPDGVNLVQDSNESFTSDLHPLSVIGNRGGTTQNHGSLGKIDDVRIYDRVLSDSEIESLASEHY